MLIIAGPGSGKTFTVVERIYFLITEKGIAPERIFVSTFTEKAAAELITRISTKLDTDNIAINLNEMYIGTFHSICLRLLEEHREFTRLKRNFTLLDQFDQHYFIYRRLSEYLKIDGIAHIAGRSKTPFWRRAEKLIGWLNKVSEEALDPDTLRNATEPEVQTLGECYGLYQTHLAAENCLDFPTIQVEALSLLTEHPEILQNIRDQIQYFMVDEYQDTNTIQEQILLKLAAPDFNLCVVGDDDQGLYRFRGATIRNILEFPQHFPDGTCQQVKLTTNYRSHPDIIEFYNGWMETLDWTAEGKTFRYEKTIRPNPEKDYTEMPTVLKIAGDSDTENWHDEVHDFLCDLKRRGACTDWNQVAFLFRSVRNRNVIALAEALEARGIPIYSPRSNLFFKRTEIRLMIGALIFLFPQFSMVRRWRGNASPEIWDYYDEDCFRTFTTEIRKPENEPMLNWCRTRAKTHLRLNTATDYAFSGLFYELLQFPMFREHLDGNFAGDTPMDNRPARNLAILSQLLSRYEHLHGINVLTPKNLNRDLRRLFNQFFRFLKDGGISEYEDASEYAPRGCVSFMTIHQAKGLEFPVVVVGSMDATARRQYTALDARLQEKYYHKKPFEPLDEMKNYDFWRLFYTAFSRPQNLLILTCQERTTGRRVPTGYFKPIYDRLPTWRNPAFQPEHLTLETIKDVHLKNAYAFTSHITVFEACARQYKFYRHLGFAPVRRNPILFGTVVHQTIEDIHKAALQGEAATVTEAQIADWFNANYAHLSQQERLHLSPGGQKAALDHVLRYARRERDTWDRLRETEVEISLVKETYLLTGRIDLVRGEGDTLEIVDFKSERKPDLVTERDKVERYRRQLEIYAHIIEGRTGHEISRMHLYYTGEADSNPYVSFDKDTSAIEQTMEIFDNTVARIESRDFAIATRPDRLCRNCDLKAYCDAM